MPTIFYSWQNDSKKTNRNLIEDALEKATRALEATIENAKRPEDSEDGSTKIEIQQGARGVPGAPDIPRTIFARIDAADAFVCDVSLTIQTEKRRSPNPNVLVELGYALKALGDSRVLMVVNTAFGPLEDLPFDLRTKLPVVYHLDPDGKKADERLNLAGELTMRLREVITQPRPTQTDAVDRAITAIREKSADRQHRVRDAVDHLVSELDKINVPRTAEVPATDTEVIAAIRLSSAAASRFAELAVCLAEHADESSRAALSIALERLLARYGQEDGRAVDQANELFRFAGYHWTAIAVASMLACEEWAMVEAFLSTTLFEPVPKNHADRRTSLRALNRPSEIVDKDGSPLRADMLRALHESGPLSKLVTFEQLKDADFCLALWSYKGDELWGWVPRTALCWNAYEGIFERLKYAKYAEGLRTAIGCASLAELQQSIVLVKKRVFSAMQALKRESPLVFFDVADVGSKT